MTRTYIILSLLGLLLGCAGEDATGAGSKRGATMSDPRPVADAAPMDPVDAGMTDMPMQPEQPSMPTEMSDAGVMDAQVAADAGQDAAAEDTDAGGDAEVDGAMPTIEEGPATGELRNLSMRLTGMDDDLQRFVQFRIVNARSELHTMFVIHEGLTSATYEWELPNTLLPDESYRLDFYIDHDSTTGPGSYDRPPVDHAWSIPIPAGDGDMSIEFPYNSDFVDIERIVPMRYRSTLLSSSGLYEHRGRLYDVRVIERESGRLVGRQLREIPGDSFDLTVSSTTREGVEYQVDIAVDADNDGRYDHDADPSWRVLGTGGADGMRVMMDASDPQIDVGF